MKWILKEEFPKNLNENCYVILKHSEFMSDRMDTFIIVKYIKSENKLYEMSCINGYIGSYDITESVFNFSCTHYCKIENIECICEIDPPERIFNAN